MLRIEPVGFADGLNVDSEQIFDSRVMLRLLT